MLVTVQTIVDSAVDLADMRNSQFIDQSGIAGSELIRYVNLAYKDLYAQIVLSKELYFCTSTIFQITGATDTYPLPNDFYKLVGVDLALDTSGRYLTLFPAQFSERNKYRSGLFVTTAQFSQVYRYILNPPNITFLPFPSQTNTVRLWYTPEPVTLFTVDDAVEIPIGGDEYMSLYVAIAMLAKEETDTTAFNNKRLEVLFQLKNSLKDVDQGAPHYIVDTSTINDGALYPFTGYDY